MSEFIIHYRHRASGRYKFRLLEKCTTYCTTHPVSQSVNRFLKKILHVEVLLYQMAWLLHDV
jgi:hypothetical protein